MFSGDKIEFMNDLSVDSIIIKDEFKYDKKKDHNCHKLKP